MKITIEHGNGGMETRELIENIFAKYFSNDVLLKMEDSAVVESSPKIAITTDSYVITPLFFEGGDIGKISICGTVNDLSMSGAIPKYITCGFIIETGTDFDTLEQIAKSMADAANEANVKIVAGDTKVIEGSGGVYINTSGVGFVTHNKNLSSSNCQNGDKIIISGNIGDHHACILSSRMNIKNTIKSDCAPLNEITNKLINENMNIKAMRDVTRGGLATVLNEIVNASYCQANIYEDKIPVSAQVSSLCKILGLDPLFMANEGKMIVIVDKDDASKALECIRNTKYGSNAAIIGEIDDCSYGNFKVVLKTAIGGSRVLPVLYGENLPRIC